MLGLIVLFKIIIQIFIIKPLVIVVPILISVITATYNSGSTLPRLITSFRKTKIQGIEWIIIDGSSRDDTVKIIMQAADIVDQYISEVDSGIYDAWNKGLKIAKGKYIAFIGSDDTVSEHCFTEMLSALDGKHNVIAFRTAVVSNDRVEKELNTASWQKPWNYPVNMGFSHPGTLHKSSLFSQGGFDASYKIAGDKEFLLRNASLLKPKIHVTADPLLSFYLGGVSSDVKNILVAYDEILRMLAGTKRKTIVFYIEMVRIRLLSIFRRTGLITGLH